MWLEFQIFLKCSKGWRKMKCRSWKKLRHRTERVNGRSCTLPLHNCNSSSLAPFCKHQEIGFCFKGAASKHPDHPRCALTWINRTPQMRCTCAYGMSESAGSHRKRTTWICQLAKQRFTEERSKKPRVVRAWVEVQHFPKAGNLPGYWHAQEDDIQLLTPIVFQLENNKENKVTHLTWVNFILERPWHVTKRTTAECEKTLLNSNFYRGPQDFCAVEDLDATLEQGPKGKIKM